ncbi:eIF4-gamma/eIF5/eIF2-epsilon family protein [Coccidioides posadasii C735 delta SOWgp]|uniref:Mannose-1-phosphate guanyltransferase n=1 Tax=Coccidioides posadasii (strain C735) TaxID=222929 RepID=C5PFS8_COCP7|nr:eIF4-gamma/eIF5/eIF2-epsilon family protein [Coccidioides posadasii C735 delta SOWgp]EER23381.1 eIF4-gamma/eIF5/eIF2-epsilon family protein [Coccidioides posadasii C735 delta SOWgp]|eukprot:XP_003065526.1 eIF4-gamma/eIF5/eIF2-epsilon family protein [Coccidioides posadasii C735 delta SOWgp]
MVSAQGRRGGGNADPFQGFISADEREELLQAVVLTDTFETRFEPFTLEKPRCLLPLANTLLIDHTLEFLLNAGIEEVFIYTHADCDLVENHLDASKWKSFLSPFKKFKILKTTATSVGDVMRDLHGKHLIAGDFLLVSGDVVSNMPVEEVWAQHRARRIADKNAIMTMILREAGPLHRTKASPTSPVFIIDPTKDRCLHYEEIRRSQTGPKSSYVSIDPDLVKSFPEIDIRNDLIDCGIDICTPEVLGLWADSFDYQSPRKHFLYGVLKDYELNGKTIHTHIVKDHYAARVRNLKAYDSVSRDYISRWVYPLCSDANLFTGDSYRLRRGNVYQEEGVVLSRSAIIKQRTIIGTGTNIGEGTYITDSVIGRRCRIGNNVILDGAYIWDDVVIGDGTEIRHAIVANGVVIGSKCRVEPGVLLSYGVKLGDDISIPRSMRITKLQQDEARTTSELLGKDCEGYEFVHEYEDEEESDDELAMSGLLYNMAELALSDASISTLASGLSEDEYAMSRQRADSFGTSVSDDEERDHFHHDAVVSIVDSLKEGLSADVVQLELVGLRMSANASEHQVRRAVVTAFMKHAQRQLEEGVSAGEAIKQLLTKYKEMLARIVFDRETDEKPDQVDLLLLFQQDLVERSKGGTILLFVAKELYDLEIVEDEAFEQWWDNDRSTATEALKKVRQQTQPFIDWMMTEESDEEESDEESGEEEDDDDDDDDESE